MKFFQLRHKFTKSLRPRPTRNTSLKDALDRPIVPIIPYLDAGDDDGIEVETPRSAEQAGTPRDASASGDGSLIDLVRSAVIGDGLLIDGPFGGRRITYADYTASGRALTIIEEYIAENVLPVYANTHTDASYTGRQTTAFREHARSIIHTAVRGTPDDVVIFGGSGSTFAVNRLVDILDLRHPRAGDDTPVIFVGPFEHHSNILPWRESQAEVVAIKANRTGHIDVQDLEERLIEFGGRSRKYGSFSAASNVTGILSDTDAVTILLHRHGALAFWDYAAAAPYVDICMNGGQGAGDPASKDAVFISPHKFPGGPGTPGILIAKRHLFQRTVPSQPGGGTVALVTKCGHTYVDDLVHREEGGTPDIVGSIRAGLVFLLKGMVGVEMIAQREEAMRRRVETSWQGIEAITILGSAIAPKLCIFSFLIAHQGGYLHYNFVVALLNDLFGIQARGGCSCAGPYAEDLLAPHIEVTISPAVAKRATGLKPGWTRLNFNYFMTDATVTFICNAVLFVAEHGSKFLAQYRFQASTGLWKHIHSFSTDALPKLRLTPSTGAPLCVGDEALPSYLTLATELAACCSGAGRASGTTLSPDLEPLRWFPLV